MMGNRDKKGMALTIVMITMILLALIGAYAMNLSINQHRLFQNFSGTSIKAYYAARAGTVDAEWRIRTDYTTCNNPCSAWVSSGGADFKTPGFTVSYNLDIDGDGLNIVNVVIWPVDAAGNTVGLRKIDSKGRG